MPFKTAFKIATWNVNSLKVRLPQVLDYMRNTDTDVLCLQEIKMTDEAFPTEAFTEAGLHVSFSGQKTYNGVATISRVAQTEVQKNLPNFQDDQQRLIASTISGVRVINVYIVNGQAPDTDKFAYKMNWLKALREYVADEMTRHARVILLGDFNIAPTDADNGDPTVIEGVTTHVSPPEREAFRALLDAGLHDTVRPLVPTGYTYWDYKQLRFPRNEGLRIDFILGSHAFADAVTAASIHRDERKGEIPSDHVPVSVDLDLAGPDDDDRPMIW